MEDVITTIIVTTSVSVKTVHFSVFLEFLLLKTRFLSFDHFPGHFQSARVALVEVRQRPQATEPGTKAGPGGEVKVHGVEEGDRRTDRQVGQGHVVSHQVVGFLEENLLEFVQLVANLGQNVGAYLTGPDWDELGILKQFVTGMSR